MSGYSNENPPASLVGAKGNALTFRNFAFKLNSGFGKYNVDFKSFSYNISRGEVYRTSNTVVIKKSTIAKYPIIYTYTSNSSFKIKVTNVSEEHILWINDLMRISEDGVYTIPVLSDGYLGFGTNTVLDSCNITITQLPSAYDGYLCFDGVDDYAECDGLPLLEDYTLICRRGWIAKPETGVTALASKRTSGGTINGAFNLERMTSTSRWTISYGSLSNIVLSEEDVIYQTTLSYNGSVISRGTAKDTPILILGEEGLKFNFAECAIAYFALYSRTLTTQEIEKEKVKLEAEWNKRLIK